MTNYSIVPQGRCRDPRQLLYHYPSIPVVRYAQLVAEFHHIQMLRLAEDIAHKQGFLLVPASVLHWRQKQEIAAERQVTVGKQVFYMMRKTELSKRALEKLQEYLEELREEAS